MGAEQEKREEETSREKGDGESEKRQRDKEGGKEGGSRSPACPRRPSWPASVNRLFNRSRKTLRGFQGLGLVGKAVDDESLGIEIPAEL
eukprot:766791-Hanusia_phi.AAC.4